MLVKTGEQPLLMEGRYSRTGISLELAIAFMQGTAELTLLMKSRNGAPRQRCGVAKVASYRSHVCTTPS